METKNLTNPQRWAKAAYEFIENLAVEEASCSAAEEGFGYDDIATDDEVQSRTDELIYRTIQEMARQHGMDI